MKKIVLIVMTALAIYTVCSAEDLKLMTFADSLYDSGDYYRAITEYKRYIFYNPAGRDAGEASYKIGLSYMAAEKWDGAIEAFESTALKSGGKISELSLLSEASAFAGKKDYEYSDMLLMRYCAGHEKSGMMDAVYYMQAYNKVHEKKWAEAVEKFRMVNGNEEIRNSSIKVAELLGKASGIQERNIILGVGLSAVLPGSGYYYCGRWIDGSFSMALNVYFMYNTYNAFARRDGGMKLAYGLPALVIYLANLYGTAAAVNKFNGDETGKFIKSADDMRIDVLKSQF